MPVASGLSTPVPTPLPDRAGTSPASAPRLAECRDCGLLQIVPALPVGVRGLCRRCDGLLRHTRRDPLLVPLALNISALILFVLGVTLTLISVRSGGQQRVADLLSGPVALERFGMWEVSAVVVVTTVLVPLAKLLCMLTVLIGLRLRRPPAVLRTIYGWVEHLRPWSMVEIYLLGLFVAYVRLSGMATVDLGPAVFALGGLMIVMVLADAMLDEQAVWEAMDPPHRRHYRGTDGGRAQADGGAEARARSTPRETAGTEAGGAELPRWRIGCDTCGLVSRAWPGLHCPRCGYRLHDRKPYALQRTWAFSIAALVLYIPANLYPVLTVVQLGAGQPSTILGGVRELIDLGMWPLAALVFFASIAVPVLKLVGLGILLISTHRRSRWGLHDRTMLYRIVDAVGRWSMIDVFMESILVALVQFGTLTSVYPGPGAIAFAAVVILTMLAARSFDPRLMWDAAGMRGVAP